MALVAKSSPANARDLRDTGSIPGSGRSRRRGHGNPPQYSCLENPWAEETGRLQSIGSERVRHGWNDLSIFLKCFLYLGYGWVLRIHFFIFCWMVKKKSKLGGKKVEKVSFHLLEWKLILIPKQGNTKDCSNYHTIALISHTSKRMLKILQARLQQYLNHELPDV